MKVVIVGGVAGGATTAARLRRLDESAEIIVIERTHYVSYANCGLPYYIGGTITDKNKLTLQTPQSFKSRFNIDVRVDEEVTSIDREHKCVHIRKLSSSDAPEQCYTETYDKLVLSPGAHPIRPNLPGLDSKRLFTLRTVEDTFAIAEFIEREAPQSATVVGGGFIGLEMAENLVDRGIEVTVLQRPSHLMPTLDDDMASLLHNRMREGGIALDFNADVTGFMEDEHHITASFSYKYEADDAPSHEVVSDMAIMAIGVMPESALAKKAGLELGIKGAIKVDHRLRTSDPDIYAIGDAIETTQIVTGKPAHIALAGPANKQGRIVANDMVATVHPSADTQGNAATSAFTTTSTDVFENADDTTKDVSTNAITLAPSERHFAGSLGTSVMKAFDMTVATTGMNDHTATQAGLTAGVDFDSVIISPASHATYYPDAETMTMKVLFNCKTGRILGAQIIGGEGVDKRIDVLALAITAKMTAYDLTEVDLAYAPPYASAKDPINMAGYAIANVLDGVVAQIHWEDALEEAANNPNTVILDVRTPGEFERGHLDNQANVIIHIPVDDLRGRLDEIPHDKHLLVHCATGIRSYIACRILTQHGYHCTNIAGGYNFYQALYLDRNAAGKNVGGCGLPIIPS